MKKAGSAEDGLYFGRNVLKEALLSKVEIEEIFYENEAALKFINQLRLPSNIRIHAEIPGPMKKYSHQGVVFRTTHSFYKSFDRLQLSQFPFVVLCNQVEDVHNLGSITRCAVAFGAKLIIHEEQNSAPMTAAAVKSSAGLAFRISFCKVSQLSSALPKLASSGFHIVGLDVGESALSLQDWIPQFPLALMLGSESDGIQPALRKKCESLVKIPMEKSAESLNVSHAAAIAMQWAYSHR